MKAARDAETVVVIGSSAGGIDALATVLSALDKRFPAAVVLAQHIEPNRRSQLQAVLQGKTGLEVVLVEGKLPLEPGKVYVPPASSDIVVSAGSVQAPAAGARRSHPSVDRLLASAAEAYGDRVVAVILSGDGSDGASGAVQVKQKGGTVVIQDPRTAAHPSMPSALPPTAVDHVADVDGIAAILASLLSPPKGPAEPDADAARHLARVVGVLARHTSVDFGNYKSSTVQRRVERRMATTRKATLADYARHLETDPGEVAALAQTLLIKVTEFFRDAEAFEFLKASILPELVDGARARGRKMRLWSAGCATGEEAYSLAMIVADTIGPEIGRWSVRVFATDLDEGAVSFARRGVYPPAVLENVSEDYRRRFFEKVDGSSYRVQRAIRQMVIYGQQDLSRAVPFPHIDLVLCRNLLIYFQPVVQQELLDLFAYSLHDTGGYLLLGKAETARPSSAAFELVNKKWKVYRCLGAPAMLRGPARAASPRPADPDATQGSRAADPDAAVVRRFDDAVLRSMSVGTVVVDRAYRMVGVNAAARRLLEIRDRAAEKDFLHSVRGIPYAEIRSAIDSALRDQKTVTLPEVGLGLGDTAEPRHMSLGFAPLSSEHGTAPEHIVITVVDVTDAVAARRRLEGAEVAQRKLVEELNATNARLNEANKELQDANDELQAANEELMLAQEELQATNEEFEATNEELQATNEELETNNEELQATNEELDTTNDELQARTGELAEVARLASLQRERLSEIVDKSPFPVAVLRGDPLVLESFNGLFAAIAGRGAVPGRTLDDALALLPTVASGVREAVAADAGWISEPVPVEDAGKGRRACVFIAVPLHDDGTPSGVALYAEETGAPRTSSPRRAARSPRGR